LGSMFLGCFLGQGHCGFEEFLYIQVKGMG